jgi:hypothetical protein
MSAYIRRNTLGFSNEKDPCDVCKHTAVWAEGVASCSATIRENNHPKESRSENSIYGGRGIYLTAMRQPTKLWDIL